MNPVGGSYDESLLREAPAATREQLQEGYNPDLLIAPTRHKSERHHSPLQSTPPGAAPPALPAFSHGSGMEQGNVVPVGKSFNSYDLLNEKPPEGSRSTSFWGSTKGKIVIGIIVALVIIGAVIGGAVGGTVGKKKTSKSTALSTPGAQVVGGSTSTASATAPVISGGIPTIAITVSPSSAGSSASAERPTFTIIPVPQNLDESFGEFANKQAIGSNPRVVSNHA